MSASKGRGYLGFTLDRAASENRQTDVWCIWSFRGGELLGRIKWFGRWRQYAFYPESGTIWNPDCLDAVNEQIRKMMDERRAA